MTRSEHEEDANGRRISERDAVEFVETRLNSAYTAGRAASWAQRGQHMESCPECHSLTNAPLTDLGRCKNEWHNKPKEVWVRGVLTATQPENFPVNQRIYVHGIGTGIPKCDAVRAAPAAAQAQLSEEQVMDAINIWRSAGGSITDATIFLNEVLCHSSAKKNK